MNLSEYLSAHGQQTDLARAIGAQPQLVWQWAKGVRPVPIERCVPIERATEGAVSRRDLRPDDWQDIWPELATPENIQPNQPPALAPPAQAAITVIANGAQAQPAAPAQDAPADAPSGAASPVLAGEAV